MVRVSIRSQATSSARKIPGVGTSLELCWKDSVASYLCIRKDGIDVVVRHSGGDVVTRPGIDEWDHPANGPNQLEFGARVIVGPPY